MELLELFISFTKIGFASFGGYSMLPQINNEMLSHGWMTVSEISDIVIIAEMTPGPVAINCATFAGMRTAGLPGALAANLGILMPTLLIAPIVAIFFTRFKNSPIMGWALTAIRPACIGLIASVIVTLSMTNYTVAGSISLISIFIGAIAMVLLLKFKLSVPTVVCISAVLGILFA